MDNQPGQGAGGGGGGGGGGSDSAILFLDTPTVAPMDGHQILNQVQLQFIPTVNDGAFVPAGSMGVTDVENNLSRPISSSVLVTGTMEEENRRNRDTDMLVMDDSFDSTPGTGPSNATGDSKLTIWQFDYYAQYFEINTDLFFRRMMWSALPLSSGDKGTYISRYIQSQPDLYGPFWIPLTLALVISICDDILRRLNASAIETVSNTTTLNGTNHTDPIVTYPALSFTFERMNAATLLTFSYVIFAPLILWSFCKWRNCTHLYTFIECICAYGYSLSVFIPVTILSFSNVRQIQFILFASAAFLSGSVLLISFAPVVHSDPSRSFKFAYVMLLFILIAHLILSLLYLYLFL